MSANNQLSLEHDPIEAWDWPAMTMVSTSLMRLIYLTLPLVCDCTSKLPNQDGAHVITTLHIQASDKGTMDHSQHEGAHE